MDAYPNAQRRRSMRVLGDAVLDRLGARNRAACAGKGEHGSVALPIDDRSAVRDRHLLDQSMVLSQKRKPGMVSDASDQDRGIDDVGEDDRYGSIGSKDPRKVGLLELERPFELIEARRQRPPEKLHIRLRQ